MAKNPPKNLQSVCKVLEVNAVYYSFFFFQNFSFFIDSCSSGSIQKVPENSEAMFLSFILRVRNINLRFIDKTAQMPKPNKVFVIRRLDMVL